MKIIKSNCIDMYKLYKKVKKIYKHTSILESLGCSDVKTSRYSIMGVIPDKILKGNYNSTYLIDVKSGNELKANWLKVMDEWTLCNEENCISSPIQSGVIGYIGYENKFLFEKLDCTIKKDHNVPDVYLVKYALIMVFDRVTNEKYWVLDGVDENVCQDIENMEIKKDEKDSFRVEKEINEDFTKSQYLDIITKTKKYIADGDIFQANMTMRFNGNYSGETFELYRHLRKITPNPFFAFFDFEYPLISTSPERFILLNGREIFTNPIKGTIKRQIGGKDASSILKNSEKDRAENTMIVDLMRNDIGRICEFGTVEVPVLCGVKKFNSIYHLESIIYGKIRENIKFSDILKATFPGGSITGAPKIRAMNIIEELELKKRGCYCGITGFFGSRGWVDTSIAIRTIYFDKNKFYFHGGGGIVADSKEESEYQELLLKLNSINYALKKFI
ncbi:anthranilate synthase component I family protein [Herbivorax sp. ANBcel31]|uniref:anthranilate synthase component I family protein n=1 Tax=Herbivorax sp. ANBcel31 TaxID=3069754 RepID=UPI0027ADDA89|nr:anthranilate synthase component I family protein [Herbivorax sp. ANBcel31]MDQ2086823.1 anthranilate synthase component I family protein [Herbivorax sp. ANBcel31]